MFSSPIGGPTAVINASVAGVVAEALNNPCIEEVYGGMNGVLGILKEELIDLAEESQQNIRGLRYTPASALGTCRFKLKRDQDYERILEVLKPTISATSFTVEEMIPRILQIKFPNLRKAKATNFEL